MTPQRYSGRSLIEVSSFRRFQFTRLGVEAAGSVRPRRRGRGVRRGVAVRPASAVARWRVRAADDDMTIMTILRALTFPPPCRRCSRSPPHFSWGVPDRKYPGYRHHRHHPAFSLVDRRFRYDDTHDDIVIIVIRIVIIVIDRHPSAASSSAL